MSKKYISSFSFIPYLRKNAPSFNWNITWGWDGSLASGTKGFTWTYQCLHSEQQKEYLFHKDALFKNYCLSPPRLQEVSNQQGKKRKRWYFNTRLYQFLKYYGELFYVNNSEFPTRRKKRVPPNTQHLLQPRILVYWFMDDGDQKWRGHSRALRLFINSFSFSDCELLQTAMEDAFGLRTTLQKADITKQGIQQYRFYFSSSCYYRIKELIYEHLLPSMLYKFSL